MRIETLLKFLTAIFFSLLVYFIIPRDFGDELAVRLFSIFIFTISSIMLKIFSMGQSALISLALCLITKTLTFTQAFSGFLNSVVWLVVLAFFIAKGFVKTGLGLRIAYHIMKILGKKSIGLGYGIALTDLIIAPVIPSMTARSGGVIFPVVAALDKVFQRHPNHNPSLIGSYLLQTAFQTTNVTGAMFLTAMAGNPMIVDLAKQVGVTITWGLWLKIACVPCLIAWALVPWLLYIFFPPQIKETPEAPQIAKDALREMGAIKKPEWMLILVFSVLLILWIFGYEIGIDATVAAMLGVIFLLLTKVLTWDEIISEKSAWDTLIWFSTLVMIAGFLNQFGLISAISSAISKNLANFHFVIGFLCTILIYFYSHYFFASNVAHIGAMFPAFLSVLLDIKTTPIIAVMVLAFISNLFGCLTHYGSGPAPIFFGMGYIKINTWWKIGFFMSLVYLGVFLVFGGMYWKILGLF